MSEVKVFNPFADIVDFHTKYQQTYDGPARRLPEDMEAFRLKFLNEELTEYTAAIKRMWVMDVNQEDLANAFDGLIDLVYVALGTAYLHGFDFEEGWRRVHEANMKKVLAKSAEESARGYKFDVVKPEGWTPPILTDLVGPK